MSERYATSRRRRLLSVTLFLAVSTVYHLHLLEGGYIVRGDATEIATVSQFLGKVYPIWNFDGGFSNAFQISKALVFSPLLVIKAFAPNLSITYVFFGYYVLLSTFAGQSIVRLCQWTISNSGIDTSKSRYWILVSVGLFYISSPYVIEQITHPTIRFGYYLSPAILYTFIRGIREDDRQYLVISVVLWSLATSDLHWLIFGAFVLFGYAIYDGLYSIVIKNEHMPIQSTGINSVFVFVLFCLINSYWLIPTIFSRQTSIDTNVLTIEGLEALFRHGTVINTFAARGNFLLDGRYGTLSTGFGELTHGKTAGVLLLISAFGLASLLYREQGREQRFMPILFVITVFLSTGPNLFQGLFNELLFKMPFHSYYAWSLRTPKFHQYISLSLSPMIALSGCITISSISKRIPKPERTLSVLFVLLLLSMSLVANYPLLTTDYNNRLDPTEIPSDYQRAEEYLSSVNGSSKAIWGPRFAGREAEWHLQQIGKFHPDVSPRPTLPADNRHLRSLFWGYRYGLPTLTTSTQIANPGRFVSSLHSEFIVVHNDVIGLTDETTELTDSLRKADNIRRVRKFGDISIYQVKNPKPLIHAETAAYLHEGIQEYGSVNRVAPDERPAFVFSGQLKPKSEYQSEIVVLGSGQSAIAKASLDPGRSVIPFDRTHHYQPKRFWSKTHVSSIQFQRALQRRGLPPLGHYGYGKGTVISSGSTRIRNVNSYSDSALVSRWQFSNQNASREWRANAQSVHSIQTEDGKLVAALNGSSFGWKTVSSPLIPVNATGAYNIQYKLTGDSAHQVHVKVVEFDENKTQIETNRLTRTYDGSFSESIAKSYVPKNASTEYIQIQIWHGHNTTEPLPNRVSLDDVRIYNVTQYAEPVNMKMQFTVDETGDYRLFGRYFANEQGGRIRVSIDGEPITVNTEDKLNEFIWKNLTTRHLDAGEHTIVLENVRGFNAVNLFTLVREEVYQRHRRQLDRRLENRTIAHLLEAESDLYLDGATTRSTRNASNGRVAVLSATGDATRTVETVTAGQYRLAVRGEGNFTVRVDDRTWNVTRKFSGYAYTEPIRLDRGTHEIGVQPARDENATLDVVWLYSTPERTDVGQRTVKDVFTSDGRSAAVESFERVGPTKYRVHVNASEPYMLSFAEGYDPLWVAEVQTDDGTRQVDPVPLYGVTTGFWMEQTGEYTVTIRYRPQRWFRYGAIISALALVACIGYLCYDWRRRGTI